MSSSLGDMNLGGPASGGSGALGLVRQLLEELFGDNTNWVATSGNQDYVYAILMGALRAFGPSSGIYSEDLTSQVDGARVSFTTSAAYLSGRTRLIFNGQTVFDGFSQPDENTIVFAPYPSGGPLLNGDHLVVVGYDLVDSVPITWEHIIATGGTPNFSTTNTYSLEGTRLLLNGVYLYEDEWSTVDGQNFVVEPGGPGTYPDADDTLTVEGVVDG